MTASFGLFRQSVLNYPHYIQPHAATDRQRPGNDCWLARIMRDPAYR
ncbi:hypothetical protein ACUXAV_002902 [Cupriavidus metallidurans]|nr:hypothetical protein [Cupriavidus metallidurans]MDE4919765.1 hypothetical protein [Cupriavidus metallidurans]